MSIGTALYYTFGQIDEFLQSGPQSGLFGPAVAAGVIQ